MLNDRVEDCSQVYTECASKALMRSDFIPITGFRYIIYTNLIITTLTQDTPDKLLMEVADCCQILLLACLYLLSQRNTCTHIYVHTYIHSHSGRGSSVQGPCLPSIRLSAPDSRPHSY